MAFTVLFLSSSARAQGAPRLPNGLTVVIQEDASAPVVAVELRYTAGSIAERPNERGLALFTAEMMRDATVHVPAGGFDRLLEDAGGYDAACVTGRDSTRFSVTLPSNRLALALWILSDQMGFFTPRADATMLARVREKMLNARRHRVENAPAGAVDGIVNDELFGREHPYGGTVWGPKGALEGFTLDQVLDFYNSHFGPESATLVIAGDVRKAEASALVEDYFEAIPRGTGALPKLPPVPAGGHEVRLDVRAHVDHALTRISWLIPGGLSDEAAVFDVLAKILSGFHSAPLAWELRDRARAASSVSVTIAHQAYGSVLQIEAVAAPGHTTEELLAGIDATLQRIAATPVLPATGNAAVNEVVRPTAFAWERATERSRRLGDYAQMTGEAASIHDDIRRVTRVSPEALQSAAQALVAQRRVVTFVTPSAEASLGGLITGRVER
jgi:zinc protease